MKPFQAIVPFLCPPENLGFLMSSRGIEIEQSAKMGYERVFISNFEQVFNSIVMFGQLS